MMWACAILLARDQAEYFWAAALKESGVRPSRAPIQATRSVQGFSGSIPESSSEKRSVQVDALVLLGGEGELETEPCRGANCLQSARQPELGSLGDGLHGDVTHVGCVEEDGC